MDRELGFQDRKIHRAVKRGELKYQDGPKDGRVIRCDTFVRNITALSEYMRSP